MNTTVATAGTPSFFTKLLWRFRAWRRRNEPGNYELHALRELKAAGYDPNDPEEGPNKWIQQNLLELLRVFSKQGHSGSSAPYCANMFKKLALFEPLAPLSGTDDEWHEYTPGKWQNRRCSHVFKDEDGAYDINGIIWREPDGSCFTNFESRVPVTFPYTPRSYYRDRSAVSESGES